MNEDLNEIDYELEDNTESYTEEDFARDITYKDSKDVIVNRFRNFTNVIQFKRPFLVVKGLTNDSKIDRRRKFKWSEDDSKLEIAKSGVTFNDLETNLNRSRRRALDNFFGYALSNKWKYFITITFDPLKINRKNRSDIMYAWKTLRQKLQYHFKGIKLLFVDETHADDESLHFHGLIGNADITKFLSMAINNKRYKYHYDRATKEKIYELDVDGNYIPNPNYGHLLKSEFGDQIYNFDKNIFSLGFTTVIQLGKEDVTGDNDKIVMYLQKYMCKDYNSIAYNKKSYFRTYNLDFKEKYIINSYEFSDYVISNSPLFPNKYAVRDRDNEKYRIFRFPNSVIDKIQVDDPNNPDLLITRLSKLISEEYLAEKEINKEDYIKAVTNGEIEYTPTYKNINFKSNN